MSINEALQQAFRAYESGDVVAAKRLFSKIIQIEPKQPDANKNMGAILAASGDLEEALPFIKTTLEANFSVAQHWYNYIDALFKLDRFTEASELMAVARTKGCEGQAFDELEEMLSSSEVELKNRIQGLQKLDLNGPTAYFINFGIGEAWQKLGKLDEAIEAYNKALSRKPDYPEAYFNMAITLKEQGRLEEAIKAYNKALAIKPDYAEAHNNMGVILQEQGKLEEAIEAYNKVLIIQPDYAAAYNNMGVTLKDQGKREEAIAAYNNALAIKPDFAEAYNNMGIALADQGKLEEAIEAYNNALAIKPDFAEAYSNMGNVLKEQGKLEEAIKAYNKALAIKPDYAEAHNNMGVILQEQGKLEEAIEAYNKALAIKPDYAAALYQVYNLSALMCHWETIPIIKKLLTTEHLNGTQSVYGLLALADNPALHLKKTTDYASRKYGATPKFKMKPFQKSKRIKVGYFSSYFRQHPVSMLSCQMLEQHNKEQFETFAFYYGPDNNDYYNLQMRKSFDHFINVSHLPDYDIAKLAFEREIDIAVEFNGYMEGGRIGILAHQPAPIQINYLAYPSTMGANFYDYIIADEVVIPATQKSNYSENIIYLSNCYMPQDNTRKISEKLISRTDFGLPEVGFVFCCFNNSFKISPAEFDIWMRLLSKVEGSVLWLLKSNRWAEINLRIEASHRGIDPERLIFADQLALGEHLGRLKLADLFLDTFNFNAHTTASDALWAGCPVLTKMGKGFSARVAGSLLTSIELPELITTSEEEYEALALSLATNPEKLTVIHNKLLANRHSTPLFNTETYTKNLEMAYMHAHQLYAAGLPPAEFKV